MCFAAGVHRECFVSVVVVVAMVKMRTMIMVMMVGWRWRWQYRQGDKGRADLWGARGGRSAEQTGMTGRAKVRQTDKAKRKTATGRDAIRMRDKWMQTRRHRVTWCLRELLPRTARRVAFIKSNATKW